MRPAAEAVGAPTVSSPAASARAAVAAGIQRLVREVPSRVMGGLLGGGRHDLGLRRAARTGGDVGAGAAGRGVNHASPGRAR
ncbi:hypothetical protein Kpho02_64090 [Kitasatospora phosalacinea]|uniref:Uncharacterized protein n=1 Tax=Kitasatospora phosalacinea TaxID=2065 RepID=A0A9W6QEK9_9ACTN|nr:hypothetical protein Kpho02_64090 [Kitasatospora phosalacinea]